jgi:hypothetical protein
MREWGEQPPEGAETMTIAYLKFHYPEDYLAALDNCQRAKAQATWESDDSAVAELRPLVHRFMQARIATENFQDKSQTLRNRVYKYLFGTV